MTVYMVVLAIELFWFESEGSEPEVIALGEWWSAWVNAPPLPQCTAENAGFMRNYICKQL